MNVRDATVNTASMQMSPCQSLVMACNAQQQVVLPVTAHAYGGWCSEVCFEGDDLHRTRLIPVG